MPADFAQQLGDGGIGGQLGQIFLLKLRPSVFAVLMIPFPQGGGWSRILGPQVVMKFLFRFAAGPQPVDENAEPVGSSAAVRVRIYTFCLYLSLFYF